MAVSLLTWHGKEDSRQEYHYSNSDKLDALPKANLLNSSHKVQKLCSFMDKER